MWLCCQLTGLRVYLENFENLENFVSAAFSIAQHPSLCALSCLPVWGKKSMAVAPLCFPSVDFFPLLPVPCSTSKSNVKEGGLGDEKSLGSSPLESPTWCVLIWLVSISGMLSIKCLLHRSAQSPSDPWYHLPHVLSDELPSLKTESWSLVSGCSNWQRLEKGSLMGCPDLIVLLPACSGSFILQLHVLAAWMCRWLVLCKSYLYLLYATKIKNTLYKNGSVGILLFKAPFL